MPHMQNTLSALSNLYRRYAVFVPMIFASALCIAIVIARIAYTNSYTYAFLIWNLFLAWPPVICAFIAYKFHEKLTGPLRVVTLLCMGVWLVFLPNAPYLITDLVHLRPGNDAFFWFDLTMFVAFAV